MKLNKLIAALSAVTMLGSLTTALTVSANESDPMVTTASLSAQLRATDVTYSTQNDKSNQIITTGSIEVNPASFMGAFYYFDKIDVPDDCKVDSVTLTMKRASDNANKNIGYTVVPVEYAGDSSTTDTSVMFSGIASAITAGNKADTTGTGDTQPSADITSLFNAGSGNAFFVYVTETDKNLKYKLEPGATISVSYSKDPAAEGKTVKNVTTGTFYDNLTTAVNETNTGDYLSLLDNVTLTERIIINNTAKKTITINGNDYSVNNSDAKMIFEINSGSTLNINNIKVNKLDFKGSAVINADNLTIDTLSLGGNNTGSKGVIKNSTITNLQTYGRITFENTSIGSVVIPRINNSSDRPTITADSSSDITSTEVQAIDGAVLPYTLFTGDLKPETITVPSGYTYADGIISESTTYDSDYFKFEYTSDTQRTFTKATLSAAKDGVTKEASADLATHITLDGEAGGIFYVNVVNVPNDVTINSITLN